MDKKIRKRIDMLHQKLQARRQLLANAKKQPDDPGAIAALEREIASMETELAKLKEQS